MLTFAILKKVLSSNHKIHRWNRALSLPVSIAELCFDSHIEQNNNNNNNDNSSSSMMMADTVGNESKRINEICRRLLNDVHDDVVANRKTVTTTGNDVASLMTMSRRIASAVRLNAFRLASCALSIRIDDSSNNDGKNSNDTTVRRTTTTTTKRQQWPPPESQIDADPFDAVKYSGLFTLACFFNHRYLRLLLSSVFLFLQALCVY